MITSVIEGDKLIICLEGRISSDNVEQIERKTEDILQKNDTPFLFDAENLSYISSAGLRFLLKLSKKRKEKLTVRNVSPEIYDIFETTGFTNLLDVKKKMRNISIDGCPMIGKGAMGSVYRIDSDTIIKVYDRAEDTASIEDEVQKAKEAFWLGVPTAIPFDIVKVGDKYGAVFELLKAQNCNDFLAEDISRIDDFCIRYAKLIKSIHSVNASEINLPRIKDMYIDHLMAIREYLPGNLYNRLLDKINSIPVEECIIHGDLQVKNIMMTSDELIIIDMDTLSKGNPIFEFAGLYMTYITFDVHEPDNTEKFLNLNKYAAEKLYYDTLKHYYSDLNSDDFIKLSGTIKALGLIRFMFLIASLGIGLPELRDIRIKDSVSELEKLVG